MGLFDKLKAAMKAGGFSPAEMDSIIKKNPQVLEWGSEDLTHDKTRPMYDDPSGYGSVVTTAKKRGGQSGVYLKDGQYSPKGASSFLKALRKRLADGKK